MTTQTRQEKFDKAKNRLLAAADIVANGKEIALIQKIYDFMEALDNHNENVAETVKKYIDSLNLRNPKKGVDYRDGENYVLTEKDKKEIAKNIKVPVVKQIIEKQTETIIKELPVVKETIIKEPIPIHTSPQEVRDLLELLLEDERLDAKAIRNLEKSIKAYLQLNPPNGPMLHPVALSNLPDVNVAGILSGQFLQWNGVNWVASSGVSAGFQQPTSGALNQKTFVWAVAPNVLCVDGNIIQKVQQDGSANWTGTTTITLTIAPNYDIFATA